MGVFLVKSTSYKNTSFRNNSKIPANYQWYLFSEASTPILTSAVSKKSSVTLTRDVSEARSSLVRNPIVLSNQETMYTREETLMEIPELHNYSLFDTISQDNSFTTAK